METTVNPNMALMEGSYLTHRTIHADGTTEMRVESCGITDDERRESDRASHGRNIASLEAQIALFDQGEIITAHERRRMPVAEYDERRADLVNQLNSEKAKFAALDAAPEPASTHRRRR